MTKGKQLFRLILNLDLFHIAPITHSIPTYKETGKMKTNILVISTSLNGESKSRIMADESFKLMEKSTNCQWLDLKEYDLPFCDGDSAYGHQDLPRVKSMVEKADGIIMAIPIYNYASGAMAKNFIELTGRAWTEKTVGFLCAAGGRSSYMSVMGLANSLMLDFRCMIVPSFVYADRDAFKNAKIVDESVKERIEELNKQIIRVATALKKVA